MAAEANALGSLTAEEKASFEAIQELSFAAQAQKFLNAFWTGGSSSTAGEAIGPMSEKADEIWTIAVDVFGELAPLESGAGDDAGKSLSIDESGQRLLDKMRTLKLWDEELNLQGLAKEMSKYDLDGDSRMSVAEFLLFRYSADLQTLAAANQEAAPEPADVEAARVDFASWDAKYPPLQAKIDEQTAAQTAWQAKVDALEAATTDESVSAVKRGRAVTDLRATKEAEPISAGRTRKIFEDDSAMLESLRESWTKSKATLEALEFRVCGIPGSDWWQARAEQEAGKQGPGGSKIDISRFE